MGTGELHISQAEASDPIRRGGVGMRVTVRFSGIRKGDGADKFCYFDW